MRYQLNGCTTSSEELVGHLVVDAKIRSKAVSGIGNTLLKLLVLTFVPADLDIPAHELGAQSAILATSANRLAELIFVNGDRNHLVFLVQTDSTDISWLQRIHHKSGRIITPANDINFFVVEFTHDVFHPCPTQAHTCTNGIDLVIITGNGDFSAISSLTSNTTDLHGAIRNFSHLGLKQTTHKIRMAS